MPTMKNSGDLISSISSELADNNAGLISAYDVRHNMEDIAFSINKIVASGDTEDEFPFFNTVKVSTADYNPGDGPTDGPDHGDAVFESGIFFTNDYAVSQGVNNKRQVVPWLGDESIDHGSIQGLGDDDHTQYYNRLGVDAGRPNALLGNMATNDGATENWINCSGIEDVGLKFVQTSADATQQEIYVSGTMRWANTDNSILENAKGVAKAWAFFNASGADAPNAHLPKIHSWHNIESIAKKAPGQFKITFASGTFENNHFVAIGTSNGTNASGNLLDMETNTVACVARSGSDDNDGLRSVTYVIRDEAGSYTDSAVCSFVAYGYSPAETSGTVPTVLDEFIGPSF